MKTNKLIYKLAKNKKSMTLLMQEDIVSNLSDGDPIFLITKDGIKKDIITDKKVYTEKSIFVICAEHRICAKDIGYSAYPNKKDAKRRVKKLRAKVNRILLERDEYDLNPAFDIAERAQAHVDNYYLLLKKLDKKFPIEGYMWTFEPNDAAVVLQKDFTERINNNKSLKRQISCVEGNHMLVKLTDSIFWCQNCGTVIKTDKDLSVSKRNPFNKVMREDGEYFYPMSPHFLPKKK